MAKFEVLSDVLQHVDESKGYYDRDGTPKKINEHKKGDIVDFEDTPEERIADLIRLKAIRPAKEKKDEEEGKKGGQSSPPPAGTSGVVPTGGPGSATPATS
jgi:hypothetical protein